MREFRGPSSEPSLESGHERLPEGREAVREMAKLGRTLVHGYAGTIHAKLTKYVREHPGLPRDLQEILLSASDQAYTFGEQLEKLLPRAIGMHEGHFADMLSDIDHELRPNNEWQQP